jgi:hypothetical protein
MGTGSYGLAARYAKTMAPPRTFSRCGSAASMSASPRTVWHTDAVAGAPTEWPRWQPQVWRYADATFLSAQVPAAALATALDPASAGPLVLGEYTVPLPALSEQVNWQRKPSRSRYESVLLPWPTRVCSLTATDRSYADRPARDFLIGEDCPSFPSYETAFRAFF